MTQLLLEEELIGKTITRTFEDDDYFFLFFEKDEFAIIKAKGFDCSYIELENDLYDLKPTAYNAHDLYKQGFISEDQLEEFKKKEEQETIEFNKQKEINQLKNLLKKYPDYKPEL